MDEAVLVSLLADLTGNLSAEGGTRPEALRRARRDMAEAILNGQREVASFIPGDGFVSGSVDSLPEETLDALRVVAQDAIGANRDPSLRIFRRGWPVVASHVRSSVPAWAGGWAAESLGPFAAGESSAVWFDVRHTSGAVLLLQATTERPLLRLPGGTLPAGAGPGPATALNIPPGSVWLAASLFDASAPSGSYFGLRVRGGSITFGTAGLVDGSTIRVEPGVVVTVNLRLEEMPPQRRSPHAGDARDATATLPDEAVFAINVGAGARLAHVAPMEFEVYGHQGHLRNLDVPAHYNTRLGRIWFPMSPDRDAIAIGNARSTIFRPDRRAMIESAGWAVPVALPHAGNPINLGDAAGTGAAALSVGPGLELRIAPVAASQDIALDSTVLLVEPGQLTALAQAASARYRHRLDLWDHSARRRSRVELRSPHPLTLVFDASAAHGGGEALAVSQLECDAHLDRPVTAAGKRMPLGSRPATLEVHQSTAGRHVALTAGAEPPRDPALGLSIVPPGCSFALSNAFARTSPALAIHLVGVLAGDDHVVSGRVALRFALQFVLPTLPDPYAANVSRHAPRREADPARSDRRSPLIAAVDWTDATVPRLSFDLRGDEVALVSALLPIEDHPIERDRDSELRELEGRFTRATGQGAEIFRLLDVSSRADLFGVGFSVGQRERDDRRGQPLRLRGMEMIASTRHVSAFTLPAFQWEPVYNLPAENTLPFPRKLVSPTDGGPTRLATTAATLVPVVPLRVLDTLITEYNRPDGELVARFTLPFGLVAVAELRRHAGLPQAVFVPPHVGSVRPDFAAAGMSGGMQVTLGAGGAVVQFEGGPSPGLPGATLQTDNAVPPLNVLRTTDASPTLPSVDDTFNTTFAATMPIVPVRRIDVSGYGATTFSDWRHRDVKGAGVTQVKFEALIGRTSREVVEIRSKVYPWGAIFVRIITMERTGSGGVFRRDSGWQPASDGDYDLPRSLVHAGVVPRLTRIRRIRDTTNAYVRSYGPGPNDQVKLAQVVFDADVEIEGVTLGANADRLVPSRDIVGYVQLTPVGVDLSDVQIYDLLAATGPIGGPIDCELNVAQSGLHMRLSRIEVDRTSTIAGNPQFVAVARGTVEMPSAGQWTFAYRGPSEPEPRRLEADRPIPLIRANPIGGVVQPYRFADPRELHRPTNPDSEYGLLQATGAQRMLVPQPQVRWGEPIIHGGAALLFADMYALAGGVALFPRADRCHPLPAGSTLRITGRKKVRLDIPPQPGLAAGAFKVGSLERTLSHTASMRMRSRFRPDSTITLIVDSDLRPDWSCSFGPVTLLADIGELEELMQAEGTVTSSSEEAPQLRNPMTLFGGPLAPVQAIIGLLSGFGLPFPFDVSITNDEYEFKSGWKYVFPDYNFWGVKRYLEDGLGVALEVELVGRWGKESKSAKEIGKEVSGHSLIPTKGIPKGPDKHNWHFIFECEVTTDVEVLELSRLIQLMIRGALKIEIGGEEDGKTKLQCLWGLGGAVDIDLGDLVGVKGARTYFLGFRHLIGTKQVFIAVASEWEVEGELLVGLVAVKVSFELLASIDPANDFKFRGEGTIGIDVTLGWVLSKEFEAEVVAEEDMTKEAFIALMVLP